MNSSRGFQDNSTSQGLCGILAYQVALSGDVVPRKKNPVYFPCILVSIYQLAANEWQPKVPGQYGL